MRIELIMELCRVVPEWIKIRELAGKGKLVKVVQAVTQFTVN